MIGARMLMAFFAAGLDPVFQIWLARSAPPDKRALFLGWGTSFRALGWFICAATAGGVAMLGGVRMVFMVTAGLFFLLAPFILATSRRLTAVSAAARGA
jgi:MFS family permease